MNNYYKYLVQELVNNGYIVVLKDNKDIEIMIQLENKKISNRMEVRYKDIEKAFNNKLEYFTLAQLIQGKLLDYIVGGIY